jgi:hypothetical protein
MQRNSNQNLTLNVLFIFRQEEDSGLKGIRLHKEDRAKSIPVDLEPEKSENDDFSPVQDSGTQLRHRRGAKAEKVSLEGLNKDRKMSTRGSCSDPLRWFGVLVPQSLRSAKKIFNEGKTIYILKHKEMSWLELDNNVHSFGHQIWQSAAMEFL